MPSVKMYYTHVYTSEVKGFMENASRPVRRWYPKGSDFSYVSAHAIRLPEIHFARATFSCEIFSPSTICAARLAMAVASPSAFRA